MLNIQLSAKTFVLVHVNAIISSSSKIILKLFDDKNRIKLDLIFLKVLTLQNNIN